MSEEIRIARGSSKLGDIIRIDKVVDNIYFRRMEICSCLIALLFSDFDNE